jgi:hypothetical protein
MASAKSPWIDGIPPVLKSWETRLRIRKCHLGGGFRAAQTTFASSIVPKTVMFACRSGIL